MKITMPFLLVDGDWASDGENGEDRRVEIISESSCGEITRRNSVVCVADFFTTQTNDLSIPCIVYKDAE